MGRKIIYQFRALSVYQRVAYDDMGNFSIKREKNMLACYSEQEKNRQKVNPVWIYRKSPVSVSATAKPSSPSYRLRLEYGGKELDLTSGLDAYDFGARIYCDSKL